MCHGEGYGFEAVYCSIGYVNQSVWEDEKLYECRGNKRTYMFYQMEGKLSALNFKALQKMSTL